MRHRWLRRLKEIGRTKRGTSTVEYVIVITAAVLLATALLLAVNNAGIKSAIETKIRSALEGQVGQGGFAAPSGESPSGKSSGSNGVTTALPAGKPRTIRLGIDRFSPVLTKEYKLTKAVVKDILLGQVKLVDNVLKEEKKGNTNLSGKWVAENVGYKLYGKFARSLTGALVPTDTTWGKTVQFGLDSLTFWDNYRDMKGYLKSWKEAKTYLQGIENNGSLIQGLGQTTRKAFSALSPWTAIASGAFSVYEAYQNFTHWDTNSPNKWWDKNLWAGVANVGDTLVSAAAVASSIPGAQPVAAGLAVAGFVFWTAGTLMKNPVVSEEIKKGISAVANTAKKAWDTIKGWFS